MDEFYDIFISYCQQDNTPYPTDEDRGWVSDFHQTLDRRLYQVLGERCKIFRDPQLVVAGDKLTDAIKEKISNSYFLLVIVSPLYLNSKWCTLERSEFLKIKGSKNGINRIIRIDKLPVPPPPIPKELKDKYEYRFFETDPETKKPFEISRLFKDSAKKFHIKINDLAYNIRDKLDKDNPIDKCKENTIYLAETSSDMLEFRQEIARELSQRRYHIISDKFLSPIPSHASTSIKEHLKQSFLSIHIIGKEYEPLPPNGKESIVERQFREASEYCQDNKFCTLVWVPKGLGPEIENPKKLIETIENDRNKSDLICSTIEEFKTEINDLIAEIKERDEEDEVVGSPPKGITIYLYYSRKESRSDKTNQIADIKKYLFQEGYDVLVPDHYCSDNETETNRHKTNLEDCDAILFYFGISDINWNNEILWKLRKNPDFEKRQPFKGKCIYLEEGVETPTIRVATTVKGKAKFSGNKLSQLFLHTLGTNFPLKPK